ncbi:MAG: helix-turn-helix transcriptional regulator [Spirochaetales bacterium]|nr:helix-turn-helix transcriptional regulator [Spirochaetales bacterium]
MVYTKKEFETIRPLDELAELIRKERKEQKLTLKGLEELSGVSYSTLAKLESGDDGINLKTLKQVVKTLGLKLWIE